jgi:ankyrin repeat protein
VNQGRTDTGATPLYIASQQGHVEVVRVLLDANAAVNQETTDNGVTPLHVASHRGHLDVMRVLLVANADVVCCSRGGESAVFEAASSGHLDVVRLLVGAGADVNSQLVNAVLVVDAESSGLTPLGAAMANHHDAVAEFLRQAGASA